MPARQSKKKDLSQIALEVVESATGTELKPHKKTTKAKNPHAVALSKLGASKEGKARAKALSAPKRKEIDRKAAHAPWKHST